jgi:arylsulfatase A-like enzyme
MVIAGPGFSGGREVNRIVELLDLPRTIAHLAGASPDGMQGRSLLDLLAGASWRDEAYRADQRKLCRPGAAHAALHVLYLGSEKSPSRDMFAEIYTERFLFDNEADPDQSTTGSPTRPWPAAPSAGRPSPGAGPRGRRTGLLDPSGIKRSPSCTDAVIGLPLEAAKSHR